MRSVFLRGNNNERIIQRSQFPKYVILHAVFFYRGYGVSYRDLEEIMAERCVTVDHTTLNRSVERYAVQVAKNALRRKQATDRS